jgi:hypothetical protein
MVAHASAFKQTRRARPESARPEIDGLLRDLAFAYHATEVVRQAMTAARRPAAGRLALEEKPS